MEKHRLSCKPINTEFVCFLLFPTLSLFSSVSLFLFLLLLLFCFCFTEAFLNAYKLYQFLGFKGGVLKAWWGFTGHEWWWPEQNRGLYFKMKTQQPSLFKGRMPKCQYMQAFLWGLKSLHRWIFYILTSCLPDVWLAVPQEEGGGGGYLKPSYFINAFIGFIWIFL